MRVALLSLELGGRLAGVDRALTGQAHAARVESLPIDVIVVNPEQDSDRSGVRFVRYHASRLGRFDRLFKSRLVRGSGVIDDYDVVFLRYPMAIDFDPTAVFRSRRARIVTVHHTKEVPELLSQGKTPGMLARAAVELFQGRRLLRAVDGVVGVTDEIREYEIDRAGRAMQSMTISNGIDVAAVRQTGFLPFDGKHLKLLFIASSHAPWHGTDRLLESLRMYRGPERIVLDMVGNGSGAPAGAIDHAGAVTIRHHGPLHGPALDAVFAQSNLALSSLAMFRAGLRQACVLKTREYVARGMPFVYAYDDVDLPEQVPFALRLANEARPFEVARLVEFARSLGSPAELAVEMRRFAERRLDWRVKVRAYHDFARRLA